METRTGHIEKGLLAASRDIIHLAKFPHHPQIDDFVPFFHITGIKVSTQRAFQRIAPDIESIARKTDHFLRAEIGKLISKDFIIRIGFCNEIEFLRFLINRSGGLSHRHQGEEQAKK